eukprot:1186105-Prorocentrum_minimum.AAC.2
MHSSQVIRHHPNLGRLRRGRHEAGLAPSTALAPLLQGSTLGGDRAPRGGETRALGPASVALYYWSLHGPRVGPRQRRFVGHQLHRRSVHELHRHLGPPAHHPPRARILSYGARGTSLVSGSVLCASSELPETSPWWVAEGASRSQGVYLCAHKQKQGLGASMVLRASEGYLTSPSYYHLYAYVPPNINLTDQTNVGTGRHPTTTKCLPSLADLRPTVCRRSSRKSAA